MNISDFKLSALSVLSEIQIKDTPHTIREKHLDDIIHYIKEKSHVDIDRAGNYLRKDKTGLARSIEWTRGNEKIYIHCGSKSIPAVGSGSQGKITTTLSYERKPEVLARKVYRIEGDQLPIGVTIAKRLQGKPGIIELRDDAEYTGKDKTRKVHCIFKKYNRGSLESWLETKEKKTFQDKIGIAKDVITGINEMHSIGLLHRDIKLENVLIEKKDEGAVRAVITDFDTTYDLEVDKDPIHFCHGTRFYNPPFGFIPLKVARNEYQYIDVYAAGCVLDMLFNEKSYAWTWMKQAIPSKRNRILQLAIDRRKLTIGKELSQIQVSHKIESLILDMLGCGLIKEEKEKVSIKECLKRIEIICSEYSKEPEVRKKEEEIVI